MSAVSVAMVIISVEALRESAEDWTAGCFTPAELDYCRGFRDPLYPLAARFCAKWAFQLWGWAGEAPAPPAGEVEVLRTPFGPPQLDLRGEARRLAAVRHVKAMHLSLSHCLGYAGALLAVTAGQDKDAGCDGWSSPA
jgi:holo-[acyl-carrier protein] synthase